MTGHERAAPVPGVVGRALAGVYGFGARLRARAYDRGRGVIRLDRPVISVGNLSVGGTGKTPMVSWIVDELLGAGRRPCIAMRGYRSRASGGESDEAGAYRRAFDGLSVVAQPDRLEGLFRLFAEEGVGPAEGGTDCVVLDDGFQHRRIHRDLDVVLIDASRDPFEDALLPAGWLREPLEGLERADEFVITHADAAPGADVDRLEARLGERFGRAPIARTLHVWRGLEVLDPGGGSTPEPAAWLAGRSVLAVCAIGNPGPFLAGAARAAGRELAGRVVLRDHDAYRNRTVERIVARARETGAGVILTTDKDWSKLGRVAPSVWPCPVARPRLAIGFERGEGALRERVLRAAVAYDGSSTDPGLLARVGS